MKLDHVVLLTRQFEAMTAAFEQMGFLLTPVGEHGPDAGTANRCITFADHYVEILGVRTDTPMNAPLRALLEHGPAVNMVALLSHDIAATFGDLQQRGVPAQPPFHISRDMAAGGKVESSVVVVMPAPGAELPPFFCQQKTPQTMFAPQWRRHPNGATSLISVDVEAHDPKQASAAFENVGAAVRAAGGRQILTDDGPAVTLTSIGRVQLGRANSGSGKRACALTMAVSSVDAARSVLESRKTAFREVDGSLVMEAPGDKPCFVRLMKA
jgi:hypothetical protein